MTFLRDQILQQEEHVQLFCIGLLTHNFLFLILQPVLMQEIRSHELISATKKNLDILTSRRLLYK